MLFYNIVKYKHSLLLFWHRYLVYIRHLTMSTIFDCIIVKIKYTEEKKLDMLSIYFKT